MSRAFLHLSLNSPGKQTPCRFPSGGPYRESCPSPVPSFTCLSNFSTKVLLMKKLTLLSKALGKELPSMFPKTESLWIQMPISRALLSVSFGVPIKGALPPGSPHRAPTRDTVYFQTPPSFSIPGKWALFQAPQQGPYGKRCLSPEPSFRHPSGSPVKEPTLQVPLTELPQRKMLRFQSPPSTISHSSG